MKNQYFGDINDYRKYGLLRAFAAGGIGNILVAWMLTPNDGRRDGSIRAYLKRKQREKWRRFDPELYDGLVAMLASRSTSRVSLIETSGLLPGTKFYSAVVPDTRTLRDRWRAGLIKAAAGTDLVFIDPDNGIEVPSKPIGRKGSSKYVTWEEIQSLWTARCSLLIFQYCPRERREAFAARMIASLRKCTGARFVQSIRAANVVYFLVVQSKHESRIRRITAELSGRWEEQIEVMRLNPT
jgi:hypothetical protein